MAKRRPRIPKPAPIPPPLPGKAPRLRFVGPLASCHDLGFHGAFRRSPNGEFVRAWQLRQRGATDGAIHLLACSGDVVWAQRYGNVDESPIEAAVDDSGWSMLVSNWEGSLTSAFTVQDAEGQMVYRKGVAAIPISCGLYMDGDGPLAWVANANSNNVSDSGKLQVYAADQWACVLDVQSPGTVVLVCEDLDGYRVTTKWNGSYLYPHDGSEPRRVS